MDKKQLKEQEKIQPPGQTDLTKDKAYERTRQTKGHTRVTAIGETEDRPEMMLLAWVYKLGSKLFVNKRHRPQRDADHEMV